MKIRALERNEIDALWSIDRTETIENVYVQESGGLVLRPEHHDVEDWPAGETERDRPKVFACLDRGGAVIGAFEGEQLVGGAVLDVRFMGLPRDRLQLMFLYVSRAFRNPDLFALEPEDIHLEVELESARKAWLQEEGSRDS